jgi:hypothetical protein
VPAPETLTPELERLVRREQRDKRLPSIAAAVVRDGEPGLPEWRPSAVFVRVSDDRRRTESGIEQGEALRLERDADGCVVRMVWAGYPVTREPTVWA